MASDSRTNPIGEDSTQAQAAGGNTRWPNKGAHLPTSAIADADLRAALELLVLRSLPPVSTGLGVLYIFFAVSHWLVLPEAIAPLMSSVAAGTAVTLFGLGYLLGRRPIPPRWVYPIGAGIAGLVLLNSLLHLYLTSEPQQTTNLILLMVGSGFFFLSSRWLTLVLVAVLSGWGFIVWLSPPSPAWLHFGFALLTATVLAGLVHTIRVRTLRQLERLRFQAEFRKVQLEQALQETQERETALRALLESASEGVVLVDDAGQITLANAMAEKMFGYAGDELAGRSIEILIPEGVRDVHAKRCAGFFRNPTARPMGIALDLSGRRKDGTEFPVEISLSFIETEGRITTMVLATDITKRKRAEDALKEYSERLEELVEERTRGLREAQAKLLAQQRLQQEVEMAAQIQASLLPRQVPSFQGFEFAALALPARYVSGDLYDFIFSDPETCHVVLADIAGKGIPAALLASTARTLLRAETDHDDSPAAILSSVNRSFYKDLTQAEMFITFLVARLEARAGTLTYANAGHTETLWWQQAGRACRTLPATGIPIGIFADMTITEEMYVLRPGDLLVFYSDGVTEATNPEDELFGLERLKALASDHAHLPASGLAGAIIEAVEAFCAGMPRSDDVTLVVLKALPRTLSFAYPATLDHLHKVTTLVRQAAVAYGDDFAYQMELAASEIVTNVIQHAYSFPSGEIRGQIALLPDQLQVDLYDDGTSFDSSSVPAPDLGEPHVGGYGLFIAHQLTDELIYTPATPAGNHWRLKKLAEA